MPLKVLCVHISHFYSKGKRSKEWFAETVSERDSHFYFNFKIHSSPLQLERVHTHELWKEETRRNKKPKRNTFSTKTRGPELTRKNTYNYKMTKKIHFVHCVSSLRVRAESFGFVTYFHHSTPPALCLCRLSIRFVLLIFLAALFYLICIYYGHNCKYGSSHFYLQFTEAGLNLSLLLSLTLRNTVLQVPVHLSFVSIHIVISMLCERK